MTEEKRLFTLRKWENAALTKMSTFVISGNTLRYRYWKSRLEKAKRMVNKYEDLTIDIVNIQTPTPSSMIIKFTIVNRKEKYELVLQGNYQELYKKSSTGAEISPEEINAEVIIRQKIGDAYHINE